MHEDKERWAKDRGRMASIRTVKITTSAGKKAVYESELEGLMEYVRLADQALQRGN
jgi:hypothetical protein